MQNIDETTNLAKDNKVGIFMFFMNQVDYKEKKKKTYKERRTYYGVNVFKMREIVKLSDVNVHLQHSENPLVMGIVTLRNDMFPLINLAKWLDFNVPKNYMEDYKMIICDFNHSKLGLLIAEPYRIEMKSWEDIGESNAYKVGDVAKINNHTKTAETDDICFIVDIEQLLSEIMTSKEEKIAKDVSELNEDLSFITKKQPLLVAEDSRVARKHLEMIFKKTNLDFKMFENGQHLLDYIRKIGITNKDIPMIITDLEMPIVSGHKVIQEVRKYNKEIPIIVNSSMTSENNQREVLSLGATDFIGKTDSKKIVELIKKYCKK